MARILRRLKINEVSAVDRGAGENCRVLLWKRHHDPSQHRPLMFNDIIAKYVDDEDDIRDEDDDKKLSEKLREVVAAMTAAAPSLHPQRAARWLLHTPQGQALLAQHKRNTAMPQVDILKAIAIYEDVLMAQAKLQKRAGETEAKAFARLYEGDIEYRKQWAALTDAKHLQGYLKGLASLTPTSVGVTNINDINDAAEAVRLLNEMATKNGKSFEEVFADPANRKLATRTYTAAHRPTASSTSGSELQN
jgi:hypothetical protein